MEAIEQDQVIEAFAQRIMENLNMVYAEAADRKRPFANADARFAELFQLLRYYRCDEIAAEQAVNFAQIAFFRGEYLRALELFGNALESCTDKTARAAYVQTRHDMAYRMLAEALCDPPDRDLLACVETVLAPADYCEALRSAAANLPQEAEARQAAAGFLRRLSFEVLRQAIRLEPTEPAASLELLREVLPWLNEKRAALVRQEIRRLEQTCHE